MVKVTCTACSYTFDVQKRIPKDCPYCGRVGTLKRVKTAEELLQDVDRMSEGFLHED